MSIVFAILVFVFAAFMWFVWSADAVQAAASLTNPPNPDKARWWALGIGAGIAVAILVFL